jgi:hypothetical protein
MIAALRQDFSNEVFFTQVRVVHMLNGNTVSFGNHLRVFTNHVAQRIGKYFGVIEYLDLVGKEITRHTLGITNSRQGTGNNNAVIAG